jgi:RIO kinase 2
MSAIDVALKIFRQLEPEDIKILHAVETQTKQFRYIPEDQISPKTKLPPSDIQYRLPSLTRNHLLQHQTTPYNGYHLTTAGYDCLALNAHVKANILEAIGKPLGVGKEADVYDALTTTNQQVAIKFHRLGRTSFQQTKRKRNYTQQYTYTPNWHQQSTLAAKKEYKALKRLKPYNVNAPKPIHHSRHTLVMTLINGAPLNLYPKIPHTQKILNEILSNVKKTYRKANIIHADLSPYNILIQQNLHILIIDWPQYVSTNHPNAQQLLKRDLKNILDFFKRKEEIEMTLEEALNYVREN